MVCWAVAMVAFNSRTYMKNSYFSVVGSGYLFVGLFTLLHMLTYKGMHVFSVDGSNVATQLWIAARYTEAITLVCAPLAMYRRHALEVAAASFAVLFAMTCASIFVWHLFPGCFPEGSGLTRFKVLSEYGVCGAYVSAGFLLYRRRRALDDKIVRMVLGALAVSVAAELLFTTYTDVYGMTNLLGHYLTLLSFYLVYRALVRTAFENPVALIFEDLRRKERELEESEAKYRSLFRYMEYGAMVFRAVEDGQEFVLVDINDASEKMESLVREEVCGERVFERRPHVFGPGFPEVLKRVWRTGAAQLYHDNDYAGGRLKRWREVFCYRLPSRELVILYADVTQKRLEDDERQRRAFWRQELLNLSAGVLSQETVKGLLRGVADAACQVTEAESGLVVYGLEGGAFQVSATSGESRVQSAALLRSLVQDPTVPLELIRDRHVVRVTERQIARGSPGEVGGREHPESPREILCARLTDEKRTTAGAVIVIRAPGTNFSQDDEDFLGQLAAITSLGLQLLVARNDARARASTLETLLRSVPVFVWMSEDPSCRVIIGNDAANRLFGVSPGANVAAIYGHGADPDRGLRSFRSDGTALGLEDLPLVRAARSGVPVVGEELEMRLPDGSKVWVVGNASPLPGPDGKPRGAVSAYVDITERKEAENTLRAMESRYSDVLNHMMEGARSSGLTGGTSFSTRSRPTRHARAGKISWGAR